MRRLWPFILCIVSLTAAAGCAHSPSVPSGPVDAQVVLAPGQSVDVAGTSLRVQFQSVVSDTRCPGDALCIQGGDAVVRINARTTTTAETTFDLHLHVAAAEPVRVGDLSIAFETLTPYPFFSRGPIQPGDYRATLRVTR